MKHSRLCVLMLTPLTVPGCDLSGPPGCELEGDVVLETQADVDDLAGVCAVLGALEIRQAAETTDPITTLAPLSALDTVGTAEGSALRVLWTTALEGLEGLEGLTLTDGAELQFEGNAALRSLAALGSATDGGVTLLTGLRVWSNAALVDLTGVSNVLATGGAGVRGELSVFDNPSLETLSGLDRILGRIDVMIVSEQPTLTSLAGLPDATSIGTLQLSELPFTEMTVRVRSVGYLIIQLNPDLTTLTLDLESIGPYLRVSRNFALRTLAITLQRAPNFMTVNQSRELTSFDITLAEGGLGAFSLADAPALTSIGADALLIQDRLALYDTGLTTLDVFTTIPNLPEGLILVGNAQLADIEAFNGLESAYRIQIEDNPALCVPDWVSAVVVTLRTITGNLCD